jgi:hypothetical protein
MPNSYNHCRQSDLRLWHYRLRQIADEVNASHPTVDDNDLLAWVGILRRVANQMEACGRRGTGAPVPGTGPVPKVMPMKST